MKRWPIIAFALLVTLALAFAQRPADEPLVMIYSGAAFGKLKPCACSPESDLGGLLRRDTALAELQAQYPHNLLLDAGGSFKEPSEQNRLAAAAYLQSLRALDYRAVAIGPSDIVYGRDFLEQHGAGLLFVSNLQWAQVESPLVEPQRQFADAWGTVEVFAMLMPGDVYTGSQAGLTVAEPLAFLSRHSRPHCLTVVLCSTSRENARRLLDHPEVEIVINAFPDGDITVGPPYEFAGGKILTEASIYGSRLGLLKLRLRDGAVADAQQEWIPLKNTYPDGQRVAGFYREYEEQVKKIFLARLAGQPPFNAQTSPFAGSQACASCHAASCAIWQQSRHAHAWESLRKVNKTFDAECIPCHVTGFGRPGGFHSEQESSHLLNVGCENCHGAGKLHGQNRRGGLRPATFAYCRRCHTRERSPRFNPHVYWQKIKHQRDYQPASATY